MNNQQTTTNPNNSTGPTTEAGKFESSKNALKHGLVRRAEGGDVARRQIVETPEVTGLGPDGVAASSNFFSRQVRRLQTGFVYHYSFIMLIAAVAFGAYAILAGIGGGR